MSRLKKKKCEKTVIEELASDGENLSKYVRATFTMRKSDILELEEYIRNVNSLESNVENITKSLVVRQALKLLYNCNKKE